MILSLVFLRKVGVVGYVKTKEADTSPGSEEPTEAGTATDRTL